MAMRRPAVARIALDDELDRSAPTSRIGWRTVVSGGSTKAATGDVVVADDRNVFRDAQAATP